MTTKVRKLIALGTLAAALSGVSSIVAPTVVHLAANTTADAKKANIAIVGACRGSEDNPDCKLW